MRHRYRDWGSWAFEPPWGRGGRFFGAGEVRIAILSLLGEKPRHGYDLMKELETRSGGSYRVSAGTMYPALQQLEDEGMIVSETKDGKRVYQLTDLGRQELEREHMTADDIWRRTSDWGDWGQWIVGSPLGPLMKATFRAMKHATREPEMRKRVEEILDRARRELEDL
jgi:DNA-binding PadR family transcriptional regulator